MMRSKKAFSFLFVLALLGLSVVARGQTPTIDQSLDLKNASGPRISPDGRLIAYQVQETNWTENAFETEIWIAVTATGERYQLTNAKKSSNSPQWSPDGKRITTFSDRFKAVSVGAGISDWMTYYVNTDIYPFTRQYLKATPWDDPEIYRKTSPISYIKTAKTPTLIQHGELDRRVPIPNAYELYRGLEDRGVPVKMVVYKGFGHGIDKPKQQRAVMEHNYEWFSQWIWGEKPALASK